MLSKTQTLKGYVLSCTDGEIGKVEEFYFDDDYWTIRYLVADTDNWLGDQQVLISPYAIGAVHAEDRRIDIDLTKNQIEASPPLNSDKPVSRRFEEDYFGYYGWPRYWGGPYVKGSYPRVAGDQKNRATSTEAEKDWDPHLRSTRDAIGHTIEATDGNIGHVEDFIVDVETWKIRYLIADTRNLWPGKKVLIATRWIERLSWAESKVYVDLHRDAVEHSPSYTDEAILTRDYEIGLHRHYDRQGYWVASPAAHGHAEEEKRGRPGRYSP